MSSVPSAPQPQNDARVCIANRNFSRFALENNIHCLPIDETEERNYDQVNEIFNKLLGREILPRVRLSELEEPWVLDCGYGKGAWIDSVLNLNPDAYVIGLDIFTGQGNGDEDEDDEDDSAAFFVKKRWNLNASFRTSQDPQLRPESFNLINSRFLTDGINANRWPSYVKELKDLLEPEGWLQMVEVYMLFQSDNGLLDPSASFLHRWWEYYRYSLELMRKNPRAGQSLVNLMRDTGFEQIHTSVARLPLGTWLDGEEEVGASARIVVREMIKSCSVWPFMQLCRMTPEAYKALIEGAQEELSLSNCERLKLYLNVHVAYGQKPARRRR